MIFDVQVWRFLNFLPSAFYGNWKTRMLSWAAKKFKFVILINVKFLLLIFIPISILCKMDCLWKFSHSSKVCRPWHPFSFHGSLFFFAFPIGWIDFHINIFWQIWIKKCPLQFGKYIHSQCTEEGENKTTMGPSILEAAFQSLIQIYLCFDDNFLT